VNPAETVIADDPLDPGPVLFTQDLYSTDQTLAPGDGELAVREATVAVRRPTVYLLRPGDMPANKRRPDAHQWQFVLIHFRFDLKELPAGRSYATARFAVEFDDHRAMALELHPDVIMTEADVRTSRTFTIGPTLKFAGLEVSPGQLGVERRFEFTQLRPVITSFGAGHSTFSWTFQADGDSGLVAAARAVFALMQLPRTIDRFTGTVSCSAEVSRRIAGIFTRLAADGDAPPFTLRPADGTFTV